MPGHTLLFLFNFSDRQMHGLYRYYYYYYTTSSSSGSSTSSPADARPLPVPLNPNPDPNPGPSPNANTLSWSPGHLLTAHDLLTPLDRASSVGQEHLSLTAWKGAAPTPVLDALDVLEEVDDRGPNPNPNPSPNPDPNPNPNQVDDRGGSPFPAQCRSMVILKSAVLVAPQLTTPPSRYLSPLHPAIWA